MPSTGEAKEQKDGKSSKKGGIISGLKKTFNKVSKTKSKSPQKKGSNGGQRTSEALHNKDVREGEIITLSSGSEDSGVRRSSSPEDNNCLDRISDIQAPVHAYSKQYNKSFTKSQAQPDSDLSEGEIRDGDSGRTSRSEDRQKRQKPSDRHASAKKDQPKITIKSDSSKDQKGSKQNEVAKESVEIKAKVQPKVGSSKSNAKTTVHERGRPAVSTISPGAAEKSLNGQNGEVRTGEALQAASVDTESVPLIQVTFLNSYLKEKYDSTFRKLIEGILAREEDHMTEILAAGKKKEAIHVVYHDCFEIDTNVGAGDEQTSDEEAPTFGLNTGSIVALAAPETATEEIPPSKDLSGFKKGKQCFNCGGNHNLIECKAPLDAVQISKRKQEFFNSSPMTGSSRYHDNVSDEDRVRPGEFPGCGPGRISADLQSALGLDLREVPPWIFRMRNCGFPPGYVRSAVVESSGLDFIHEVEDVAAEEEGVKFDLSKLPSYPGFSAPFSREVRKGSFARHYEEPLKHQSNETVARVLQSLVPKPAVQARSPSPDVVDMEMSEEETSTSRPPTFVSRSITPASPDPSPSKEIGVSQASSRYASVESLTSIQGLEVYEVAKDDGSKSESKSQSFEVVETIVPVPSHQPHEARVLKTTSMHYLNSVVKNANLPHLDSFADGVPLFVYEETPNTGRYSTIRNSLAETRKRKRDQFK